MGVFARFVIYWDAVENWFLVLGLGATAIMTLVNVTLRYFFGMAIPWSEEVVRYLIIWISFIGMDIGVRDSKHLGVDYFVKLSGPKREIVLRTIIDIIGGGFALSLAYFGARLTLMLFQRGQLSPALQLPMGLFYLVIPLGGILTAIRYSILLRNRLRIRWETGSAEGRGSR